MGQANAALFVCRPASLPANCSWAGKPMLYPNRQNEKNHFHHLLLLLFRIVIDCPKSWVKCPTAKKYNNNNKLATKHLKPSTPLVDWFEKLKGVFGTHYIPWLPTINHHHPTSAAAAAAPWVSVIQPSSQPSMISNCLSSLIREPTSWRALKCQQFCVNITGYNLLLDR